jgi:hypothetical protein
MQAMHGQAARVEEFKQQQTAKAAEVSEMHVAFLFSFFLFSLRCSRPCHSSIVLKK